MLLFPTGLHGRIWAVMLGLTTFLLVKFNCYSIIVILAIVTLFIRVAVKCIRKRSWLVDDPRDDNRYFTFFKILIKRFLSFLPHSRTRLQTFNCLSGSKHVLRVLFCFFCFDVYKRCLVVSVKFFEDCCKSYVGFSRCVCFNGCLVDYVCLQVFFFKWRIFFICSCILCFFPVLAPVELLGCLLCCAKRLWFLYLTCTSNWVLEYVC